MLQISAVERSEYRNPSLGERSSRVLPGQYFDSETGKHYNYFRDYDPALGRYIESDPIGLKAGLNTYGYVAASPLRYSDAKGLEAPGSSDIVHCMLNPISCWNASPMGCRSEAIRQTRSIFGRSGGNDASDAFRHCYWSCCMTKSGGGDAAKGIGDAHENDRDNPRCQMNMDLFNNAMGISLAKASPGGDCKLMCGNAPLQKSPRGSCAPCGLYSAP